MARDLLLKDRRLNEQGCVPRFLIHYPKSIIGFQLIEDPPQTAYDGLKTYNQRITEHLDATKYSQESGELNRHSLKFEPNAWRVWKSFHDECQIDVRPDGRYEDI
ncbi:MAG: DUF3987 domain-containing protein [Gammaproteobacteria bacterium]|nr:DUF3987 domain-containing protein [Gammaproteobacteria bacterium]